MLGKQDVKAEQLRSSATLAWTFVRDPLARFISMYNYIQPVGHWKEGVKASICTWGCETIWNGVEPHLSQR